MKKENKRKNTERIIILVIAIIAIIGVIVFGIKTIKDSKQELKSIESKTSVTSTKTTIKDNKLSTNVRDNLTASKAAIDGNDGLAGSAMLVPDADNFMTTPIEDFNTESYNNMEENPFVLVYDNPLSTFAADTDTASYANIRRQLGASIQPDVGSVRIEEMLNYFNYDFDYPKNGEKFGVTVELAQTPWNDKTELMLIGIQTEKPKYREVDSNLVFLIDTSGSMYGPDRLDLVKRAYLTLLENVGPRDKISIVTYAGSANVPIQGADLDSKDKIMAAIENLEASGSTHGSEGIKAAYEIAEKYFIKGGNNRVILATDGDLNVGVTSESELVKLIKEEKEKGVFLSVLGFGYGNLKDDKLEALANNGNGEYYYIDTIDEARKVLSEEVGATLFTVAKDVKFQMDFNPNYIKGYRLIGYENRIMAAQDFRDDTKDGGEMGAGHSVTVLYEIVRPDSEFEIPSVSSKYSSTKAINKDNDEMASLFIRYKEPDKDTSVETEIPIMNTEPKRMSDNMLLASSIAEFGMLLKDSEHKADSNYMDVYDRLSEITNKDSYIEELQTLVDKAITLSN